MISVELKEEILRKCFRIRSFLSRINKDVIIILGNQKSGTSAIAALLSAYGKLSLTLDMIHITPLELERLHSGKLPFKIFMKRHALEFSREILKEPWLTFFYDEIQKIFPGNKKLFVIRDPRENIRSILNRLNLRGDLSVLENYQGIPPLWQKVIDNRWLGLLHSHYIDSLAGRWKLVADIYFENRENLILVKHEDFLLDKVAYIQALANRLSIPQRSDIQDKVDIQYQPKGMQNVSWIEFFGESNLIRIEKICNRLMLKFGYKPVLTKG